MSRPKPRSAQGQALVEFALILVVLLLFIFVIVESARALQAWLTVQNAAREGARHAITGQYDPACLVASPPCGDPRIYSIEQRVEQALGGLVLDPTANFEDPRFFEIEIFGLDQNDVWVTDFAGLPGRPVAVRVMYRVPVITPLLRPIRETIAVTGQVIMNNEIFEQISQAQSDVGAPGIPPLPPPGPTATPLPPDPCPVHFLADVIETLDTEVAVAGDPGTTATLYDLTESQTTPLAGPEALEPATGLTDCEEPYSAYTFTGLDLSLRANHVLAVISSDGTQDFRTIYASPADLELRDDEHTDSPDPVIEGNNLIYTVRVRNNGPAPATGVLLNDTLPSNATFVSATPTQGTCDPPSGNTLQCNLLVIPSGGSVDVTITVTADQVGTVTNSASVSGNEPDPVNSNNSSSESTTVNELTIDLAITSHIDSPDPVITGNNVIYTIIARNNNNPTATGVTLINTIPPGSTYVDASSGCAHASGTVTCNIGNLAGLSTATINITVQSPGSPGTIQNVARVQGDQTDPAQGNNQSSHTTTVIQSQATIILTPTCGPAGSTVRIDGYNWVTSGNRTLRLYWDNSEVDSFNLNTANWSRDYTIPGTATQATHTIKATSFQGGQERETTSATFTVPCPATPTPTPSPTPTNTPSPTPTPQPADLVVVGPPVMVSTPPIQEYRPVQFSVEISNIGETDISSQFFVSLYFDPTPAPGSSSTYITETYRTDVVGVNSLAAGSNKTVILTADEGFSGATNHTVYSVVDAEPPPVGLINELEETNNISTPLAVAVSPGPTPTPSPTPPPDDPGSLAGVAYVWLNGNMVPQYNVQVTARPSGNVSYVDYTDASGVYYFAALPPATYTVSGCIEIDGTSYYGSYTGAVVQSGESTVANLYLFAGTCP